MHFFSLIIKGDLQKTVNEMSLDRLSKKCWNVIFHFRFGYNLWRDAEKPTTILSKLCRDLKISEPLYKGSRVKVGGKVFRAPTTLTDEMGTVHQTHEHLALEVLKNWHTIPKHGFHLVPEHIETRPLFNPETPGIEQVQRRRTCHFFY